MFEGVVWEPVVDRCLRCSEGANHKSPRERVRDYHLGLSSGPRQQRIDTGPWTVKVKTSRELLGRAWAKACHAVGIPGRNVDDPYFKVVINETQKQGNYVYFESWFSFHLCGLNTFSFL